MRKVTFFLTSLLLTVCLFTSTANTIVRNGVTLLGVDREVMSKSIGTTRFVQATSEKSPLQVSVPKAAKRAPTLASLKGYYYTTDTLPTLVRVCRYQ